jgi:response regulator of citrate/malate metabolism
MIIEHLCTNGMDDLYNWNLQLNVMGRPTFITEKMITVVKNCIDANRRQTVRNIAQIVDISKTTDHYILSDELNISHVNAKLAYGGCSRINRVPEARDC